MRRPLLQKTSPRTLALPGFVVSGPSKMRGLRCSGVSFERVQMVGGWPGSNRWCEGWRSECAEGFGGFGGGSVICLDGEWDAMGGHLNAFKWRWTVSRGQSAKLALVSLKGWGAAAASGRIALAYRVDLPYPRWHRISSHRRATTRGSVGSVIPKAPWRWEGLPTRSVFLPGAPPRINSWVTPNRGCGRVISMGLLMLIEPCAGTGGGQGAAFEHWRRRGPIRVPDCSALPSDEEDRSNDTRGACQWSRPQSRMSTRAAILSVPTSTGGDRSFDGVAWRSFVSLGAACLPGGSARALPQPFSVHDRWTSFFAGQQHEPVLGDREWDRRIRGQGELRAGPVRRGSTIPLGISLAATSSQTDELRGLGRMGSRDHPPLDCHPLGKLPGRIGLEALAQTPDRDQGLAHCGLCRVVPRDYRPLDYHPFGRLTDWFGLETRAHAPDRDQGSAYCERPVARSPGSISVARHLCERGSVTPTGGTDRRGMPCGEDRPNNWAIAPVRRGAQGISQEFQESVSQRRRASGSDSHKRRRSQVLSAAQARANVDDGWCRIEHTEQRLNAGGHVCVSPGGSARSRIGASSVWPAAAPIESTGAFRRAGCASGLGIGEAPAVVGARENAFRGRSFERVQMRRLVDLISSAGAIRASAGVGSHLYMGGTPMQHLK
jgi:hypothetical protein